MHKIFDREIKFPILIGICGGSGSGKSEFAQNIASEIDDLVIISTDNFYRDLSYMSEEERKKVDFDKPSSVDMDELYYTLAKIKKNNLSEIAIPMYDFKDHV
ncbi:MAG: uridine kinase, partial [Candidatus Eremiobacterota bacterium]